MRCPGLRCRGAKQEERLGDNSKLTQAEGWKSTRAQINRPKLVWRGFRLQGKRVRSARRDVMCELEGGATREGDGLVPWQLQNSVG